MLKPFNIASITSEGIYHFVAINLCEWRISTLKGSLS